MIDIGLYLKLKRKLWITFFGRKSWEKHSVHLIRELSRYDLINRPNYMYGMLRAADVAKYFGNRQVTVIEFGVASGAGIINMIDLAAQIEKDTCISLRIVGFDTGEGLPSVEGYKDHPELWSAGDFVTENRETLTRALNGRAEIIWGNIANTVDKFADALDPNAPIGFVSIDVDIYSATVQSLRSLTKSPEKYNPAISMYFDDVVSFFANDWCGELAAMAEFNAANPFRKISADRSVGRRRRLSEYWYSQMYVCHILDHELRNKPRPRKSLTIPEHFNFIGESNIR